MLVKVVAVVALALCACGGDSSAQDAGQDAAGHDAEASAAMDSAVPPDSALPLDAAADATEAESPVDAGAEASCYNAAGLWICDGGFPVADASAE